MKDPGQVQADHGAQQDMCISTTSNNTTSMQRSASARTIYHGSTASQPASLHVSFATDGGVDRFPSAYPTNAESQELTGLSPTPPDNDKFGNFLSSGNANDASGLRKSNSNASGKVSIKSSNSVRVTGNFPFGTLRVHCADDGVGGGEREGDDYDDISIPSAISVGEEESFSSSTTEIFRLLDVPVDFVVGLDMMVEKSTPGFVDIPPGAHLLWVQQPGQNFRSAYWFVTGHRPQYKGHVRIKQWDRYNEVLGEVASRCERRSVLESIVEIYPHLKVYPSSTPTLVQPSGSTILTSSDSESAVAWQSPAWTRSPSPLHLWQALTDSISNEFLARVTSKKEVQDEYPVDSMDDRLEELQSSLGGRRRNVIPNLSSDLNFIFCLQTLKNMKKLPRSQRKSDDLFDLVIERLKDEKEDDLIAEMQFAFLTGTYLTNAACLGQWWDFVLHFALKAYKIAAMRPNLARRLIQTLHAQLLFTELQVASTSSPASSSTAERQPAEHDQKGDGPSGDRILYEARPYAQGKMTLQRGLEQFMTRLEADIKQRTGRLTKEHIEVCEAANDLGEWLFGLGWDVRHKRKMNPAEDDQGDEDSEDEDDLPVVVELDEDGREVGLVRFAD